MSGRERWKIVLVAYRVGCFTQSMKTTLKHWVLSMAALLLGAFTVTASASPTYLVTDTTAGTTTSISRVGQDQDHVTTQTFTGITGIQDITFRFATDAANTFSTTSVEVYFAEWTVPSGGNSYATNTLASATLFLDPSTNWTLTGDGNNKYFDAKLDLSSLTLNSSVIYGLSFLGNADTAAAGIGLGLASSSNNAGNPYASGDFFYYSNSSPSNPVNYADPANPSFDSNLDLAFSAGATTGGGTALMALSPVPETSTVAVVLAGVFVAGLAFQRKRRQALAAPATQA